MSCIDLSDDFLLEGTDLKNFFCIVDELATNTTAKTMLTTQMELLPVVDANVIKNSFIPNLSFSGVVKPDSEITKQEIICLGQIRSYFSEAPPTLQGISLNQVLEKGGSKALFEEAKEKSRLFIRYEDQFYFTSPKLPETLCARVQMFGGCVYDNSLERAAFIMSRLRQETQRVTALIRTLPGSSIRKIMILGSENYVYVPQTFFKKTIYALQSAIGEEVVCQRWRIDPFISTIYFSFPKLGKKLQQQYSLPDFLIPGICLTTSDTYDASISARPTWQIGKAIVEGHGILMAHDNKVSLQRFNREIKKEIIDRFPEFLQHLGTFRDVYVSDPEKTLSHLFVRLKVMKAVGKKRTLTLIPERAEDLRNDRCCAYDLILNLLQLPADCSLSESSAKKLRRAVYDAVFLDEKQYGKKTVDRAE